MARQSIAGRAFRTHPPARSTDRLIRTNTGRGFAFDSVDCLIDLVYSHECEDRQPKQIQAKASKGSFRCRGTILFERGQLTSAGHSLTFSSSPERAFWSTRLPSLSTNHICGDAAYAMFLSQTGLPTFTVKELGPWQYRS